MKSPDSTPCDYNSDARRSICYPDALFDWNEVEKSQYIRYRGLLPIVRVRGGRWLVDSKCEIICEEHSPTTVSGELKWALHSVKRQTSSGDGKKISLDVFECVALLTIAEIIPWTSTWDYSGKVYKYPTLTCTRPADVERLCRASRLDFVEGAVVAKEYQGRVTFVLTGGEHQLGTLG